MRGRLSTVFVGARFGRLLVIEVNAQKRQGTTYFDRVLCHCGTRKIVRRADLQSGRTQSCGCLRQEWMVRLGATSRVHGHSKHPLFNVWLMMLHRCYNPKTPQYKYYGALGIRVCDRWRAEFLTFLEDMGPRPNGRQLGRINPDGDYEPGNIIWQDARTQKLDRAQRTPNYVPRRFAWHGGTFVISDLAAIAGVRYEKMYSLLVVKKLGVDDAINACRKNDLSREEKRQENQK